MNNITICGLIAKDAVKKQIGVNVLCSFSVADSQGKEKPCIFWNCQLWGKRAESLEKYLVKGLPVTVTGEISEREWVDQNGQKKKAQDLRVSNITLQGKPGVSKGLGSPDVGPKKSMPSTEDDDLSDLPF